MFIIDKVSLDSDPPISEKGFLSLKIYLTGDTPMLHRLTELIKEVEQSSILTGTSILGGLWTFMVLN